MNMIGEFKNLHEGKRAFILASGPSLGKLDLAPLQRRLVIGLNRSALLYPNTHYHCTMDERLFDDYPEILGTTRYLFTLKGRPWGIPIKLLGSEGFSHDLEEGIYSGYTVSYFAMQVAVYMGFKELVYLGLDLKHEGKQTHFFGQDFRSRDHEETEFPRMARMLVKGAQELRNLGITTYTCSPHSNLGAFKKISYEYALSL